MRAGRGAGAVLAVLLTVALAACGSSSSSTSASPATPTPSASPSVPLVPAAYCSALARTQSRIRADGDARKGKTATPAQDAGYASAYEALTTKVPSGKVREYVVATAGAFRALGSSSSSYATSKAAFDRYIAAAAAATPLVKQDCGFTLS